MAHACLRKNQLDAYSNRWIFGRRSSPHVRPCDSSFLRTALVSLRQAIGIHAVLLPVRFWVGLRIDASFILHGALVGVLTTLIEVGLLANGHPQHWAYIVAEVLNVPCGAAGGLVAGRLRGLLGTHKEKERIVASPYNKALAFACGLLVGAFLFQRFGFDKNGELYGWEWYLGAVLLASLGLAGIFPEARPISAIGLGLGLTLVFCIEVVILDPAESMWPVVLPFILLFSFPVPIIGSGISQLLTRIRLPRAVYFVALTSALVIGALLPNIHFALQQELANKTVPEILKQIYDAEIIYHGRQPDGNFACDGTSLPGAAGQLGWTRGPIQLLRIGSLSSTTPLASIAGTRSTPLVFASLPTRTIATPPPPAECGWMRAASWSSSRSGRYN